MMATMPAYEPTAMSVGIVATVVMDDEAREEPPPLLPPLPPPATTAIMGVAATMTEVEASADDNADAADDADTLMLRHGEVQ